LSASGRSCVPTAQLPHPLGQPLVIAALVCWVTDERDRVMFFAYIATLWFGTSNAAQRIVEELAIYKRERLVGVGAHSYLASKFIFLTASPPHGVRASAECERATAPRALPSRGGKLPEHQPSRPASRRARQRVDGSR